MFVKIFVAPNNDFIFRHFLIWTKEYFKYSCSQHFDFWTKLEFLNKTWIFEQNLNFWPNLRFLNKRSIFVQNFDFWPKLRFLYKTSIFDQNFHFWPKFQFLTKSSISDQTFMNIFSNIHKDGRGGNLGKTLDFGCGCGSASIAAVLSNRATTVVAGKRERL